MNDLEEKISDRVLDLQRDVVALERDVRKLITEDGETRDRHETAARLDAIGMILSQVRLS